ncbi:MAG TPA: RNA polymerase sigma factor [Polyangiaceae bacterium]|nr:RNA polymerase sigma factor [Polyangiaceae bacterium]
MNDTETIARSGLCIEELVTQHGPLIQRVLRKCGVLDGDVDDAAQRVFLTASGKLSAIRAGSERAFLRAIAAREASHVRRTYRRRRERPESEGEYYMSESVRPDRLAVRKARVTTLGTLMNGMHSELRRMLLLVDLEGHALGEVAEFLGIPLGTCKSRLRRARADLTLRIDALPDSVRALVRS